MKRQVAVRGVIVKNGKLLCFKLKPYDGKIAGDYWCTPGGGIDDGEPLHEALEREMIEETGIKPVIGNLLYIQQFIHGDKEQFECFFHVTNAEDYEHINLDATTHGNTEIEQFEFVDASQNHVLPAFLQSESFDNLGPHTPTKIFNYM